jgi:hypothetical protein
MIQTATMESLAKENNEKKKMITGLDYDLNLTRSEQKTTSLRLADVLERERARLNDLITAGVQTEPMVFDVSTQTDFIVPPVNSSLSTPSSPSSHALTISGRCPLGIVSRMKFQRVLAHQPRAPISRS